MKRYAQYLVVGLFVLMGCGDSAPWYTARTVDAVTQAPQQEIIVSFPNPAYAAQSGGGGIPGDPVNVTLPKNTKSFYLRFDSALHLTTATAQGLTAGTASVDSVTYDMRLASLVVTNADQSIVYGMDQNTGKYTVASTDTMVSILPIWQSVQDLDRPVPPGTVIVPAHLAF